MTVVTAKRFTISEYHRLAELSFFREDERVELIRGEIIQMAAKGTSHCVCETLLCQELIQLLLGRAMVRGQQPIIIADHSEPEPDVTIVRKVKDNYLSSHPQPSDILLLIEVSNSTLKYDQEVKLPLYAEAGISNYWIFNLINYRLECYSQPYQDAQANFDYRHKLILLPHESVKLPCFPDLILDLSKVFPG
ncbi:Uma2 family endonuclease [Anabaena sp. FACHB-1237]|uniref:Uma2 family endonuclease n=1 Tax=Anabaena sp. FACHB-1237 TaxID=2692769 RepID=UPI0016819DAD|nr:Uma2 family endonuclease [Anabaena sp. FACHB-1237]MBD2138739.1 Uma2 family endonuclease [Anabaena sp. FACHB-1237]